MRTLTLHSQRSREPVCPCSLQPVAERSLPFAGLLRRGCRSRRSPSTGDALRGLGLETDPYGELIYGGWSITTQPPGVSKWLGVERYCEFVELEQPRILALGDGGNDVELLRGADVSLGIDGGDPVALSASDRIIPRPEQGGWAAVLDYL